jgi:hypothetical protein
MATVTPNFNWPVPTSTDLVKDGATAIEALGDSIDASLVDLKGGTTGQVLSKNSNTDMDFTWVTDAAGDITNVSVTSPITGGGSSGSVTIGIEDATTSVKGAVQLTDSTSSTSTTTAATPNSVKTSYDLANAAIPKSTVTTAGDVIYATGSGAVTRLGIGTAGQVLTVNGGATAPSWATPSGGGGWTSLASGSCSGSSVSLSSISGSYKNLRLVLRNVQISNSTEPGIRLNSDTGNNYSRWAGIQASNVATGSAQYNAGYVYTTYNTPKPNTTGTWIVDIPDYANSTSYKIVTCNAYYVSGAGGNPPENVFTEGAWASTAAVNAVSFFLPSYSFSAGTYELLGGN